MSSSAGSSKLLLPKRHCRFSLSLSLSLSLSSCLNERIGIQITDGYRSEIDCSIGCAFYLLIILLYLILFIILSLQSLQAILGYSRNCYVKYSKELI